MIWVQWAAVATVAWGALAFGAVYPWAYWPLVGVAAATGLAGLIVRRERTSAATGRALYLTLAVVSLAIALQLVPLPRSIVVRTSPGADVFLQKFDLSYATSIAFDGYHRRHPLSIDPRATLRSLAFLASFALLLVGLSRSLETGGARWLSRRIVALGLLMALIAIVQRVAVRGPEIYGFWLPQYGRAPFGPFVNKNHFAGWMAMALPLAVGLVSASIARGMRGVKDGWRERLLWFSSPEANLVILTAFASTVMGISLVLSFSRSAITSFAIAMVLFAWIAARRQSTVSRQTAGTLYLAFVMVVAIGWVGLDVVARRFASATWGDVGGRLEAWKNAASIAADFPLTGTGLNTYGQAMVEYQTSSRRQLFVQAHNDYLQLAAEGGLLVGIPVAIAIILLIREIYRRFREGADDATTYWIRVGASTGLVAIALQEFVEFSLQMPGNAALFAVLAALAIHRPPPPRPSRRKE